MKTVEAIITDIQRFCMHDGPGIRTTVFFKGCPLRCRWCHNPETQSFSKQLMFSAKKCISCGKCKNVCQNKTCISCGECAKVCPTGARTLCGKTISIDEIMSEVKKDIAFYSSDGGLTVSGGEPTAQPEALLSLLAESKKQNIGTAIETCGVFRKDLLDRLLPLTDLFMCDLKDSSKERLKEYTGAELDTVLENLYAIDAAKKPIILRCILVPGVNMCEEHKNGIAKVFSKLSHCEFVELLPYHQYGNSKSEQLGMTAQSFPVPEKEEVLEFAQGLKKLGVSVKAYGSKI